MTRPDLTKGACVGHPEPDLWFSERAADKERARVICRTCPVQRECGTTAIRQGQFGAIRAGLDGDVLGKIAKQARAANPVQSPPADLKSPTVHETCGKPSGARTHRRTGEALCDPCRDAAVTARREARARKRQAQQEQQGEHNAA